jgi:hypothetical protein
MYSHKHYALHQVVMRVFYSHIIQIGLSSAHLCYVVSFRLELSTILYWICLNWNIRSASKQAFQIFTNKTHPMINIINYIITIQKMYIEVKEPIFVYGLMPYLHSCNKLDLEVSFISTFMYVISKLWSYCYKSFFVWINNPKFGVRKWTQNCYGKIANSTEVEVRLKYKICSKQVLLSCLRIISNNGSWYYWYYLEFNCIWIKGHYSKNY